MTRRERNEFIEAAKQQVLENAKAEDDWMNDLMALYDETAAQLENELNAMFNKYAKDNKLTYSEAEKLLSSEENKRWHKSMEMYLDELKADNNSKTLLELNTLAAKSRISRKELMLSTIYKNMIDLSGKTETKLTALLGGLLRANYERTAYNAQSTLKAVFNVGRVDEKRIKQILNLPWSGKNYSERIWEDTDKLAQIARREVTAGFMSGSSVKKIAKNIDDVMQKGKRNAMRLARTECNRAANQGSLESYIEQGVEEYTYMGDGCEICNALNGRDFYVDEAEAGVNFPPMHPNCKCTTVEVIEEEYFTDRTGFEKFKLRPKYEEWKKLYLDNEPPEPIMELTENEEYSVRKYTGSGSYKLNEKLRNGEKLSGDERRWVKNLDSVLEKMPKYQGMIYRSVSSAGIDNAEDFIKSHIPGNKKVFSQYISSSTGVYDESFPIQYVIKSKNGRDLRGFNDSEKEIVFKRDTNFLITKVSGNTVYMEDVDG